MQEGSSSEGFEFAFNDPDFSDQVLHIQITPDNVSSPTKLKKLKYSLIDSPPPTQTNVSDCCAELQLKSLHLSSPILAAKSPFFYKLFKNGMSESQQKEATLRIYSSDRRDSFDGPSKVYLLLKMPMSLQSALSYLDLPSTVLAVELLIDASKEYLVAHFEDLHKSRAEAMELPLDALEIVLGSESLQVNSEDKVYEFILKWAHSHYPKLEDRQEILNKQLVQFISFPYMSCSMLRKALVCPDFNSEQVSELVMEVLFHKAEVPSKYFTTTKTRRVYNYRLVKAVPVEYNLPRYVIYFNLKKEECRTLPPKEYIFTEDFLVGRQRFYIGAECPSQQFSISIYVDSESQTYTSTLDSELAVIKKLSNEYKFKARGAALLYQNWVRKSLNGGSCLKSH